MAEVIDPKTGKLITRIRIWDVVDSEGLSRYCQQVYGILVSPRASTTLLD